MNNLEEAKLLSQNKEALVEQLVAAGMTATTDTPLSELADMMVWVGGLLDIKLATVVKATGKYAFFTEDEWNALSSNGRAQYAKIGLRVRACKQDFLVAKEDCVSSSGSSTFKWSDEYVDVSDLKNYGDSSTGVYDDFSAEASTTTICNWASNRGVNYQAAQAARAYAGCSVADGGVVDPTMWSLPTVGYANLFLKYRDKINSALTKFFGSAYILIDSTYWTATESSSSYAWNVYFTYGSLYYGNGKINTYRVRAVAPLSSSVIESL
jgi:hypothetical protein